jgi:hypothetical protein
VPFVRVLVLAFALALATGLSDALEVACADECAGQDCDDGSCPPLCATCQCVRCPAAVAVTTLAVEPPLPEMVATAFHHHAERVPSMPDPGEILHVPIARLV